MSTQTLLAEFPPVSTEEWEAAIREDLKGGERTKLTWRAEEDLQVPPYCRAEDQRDLAFAKANPGDYPYARSARRSGGWRIREEINATDGIDANRMAREAVGSGAEEIGFRGPSLTSAAEVALLLGNLKDVPVRFEGLAIDQVEILLDRLEKHPHGAEVSTGADPLGDVAAAAGILRLLPADVVPFTIAADRFEEQGATTSEEIGFALAAGVEYLAEMEEGAVDIACAAKAVAFSFATGPEFFIQIAKLRAFRMLWARVVESFGAHRDCGKAKIFARSARWDQTLFAPHVNILRGTTAAMSAALGGADSICVSRFDEREEDSSELGRWLARNTQLILKKEVMLGRVNDPIGGSYSVDSLTDQLAGRAWEILRQVEALGGYRAAAGKLSGKLTERGEARARETASRRLVLTGTNRFADASERRTSPDSMSCDALAVYASTAFDNLRLRVERHAERTGRTQRVLLAEFGDRKMRAARSQFCADFFACAGLKTEAVVFACAGDIAGADADVIVLCSSDGEYAGMAGDLIAQLCGRGRTTPVLVAGYPADAEALSATGVAEFVHLRSNAVEILGRLLRRLGTEE